MPLLRRFLPVLAIVGFVAGLALVAPAAAAPDNNDSDDSDDSSQTKVINGEEVLSSTCNDSVSPLRWRERWSDPLLSTSESPGSRRLHPPGL